MKSQQLCNHQLVGNQPGFWQFEKPFCLPPFLLIKWIVLNLFFRNKCEPSQGWAKLLNPMVVWSLSSASQALDWTKPLFLPLIIVQKEGLELRNTSRVKQNRIQKLLNAAIHRNIIYLAWCLLNFYLRLTCWVFKKGRKKKVGAGGWGGRKEKEREGGKGEEKACRLLCPSPSPGDCSDWSPLSHWCYLSHPRLPFSPFAFIFPQHQGLFQLSRLFTSGGQSP